MSEFEKAFEKLVYTAVDKALQKHIETLISKTVFLRVSQVSEKYHVSEKTVHNWIAQGLPVYRPGAGGVILIDEDVLLEWIKEG